MSELMPEPRRDDDRAGAQGGGQDPRMHPSLVPTGEHVAHSAIGSMLAGVVVWGGAGALADHWLGTGRILTVVGLMAGFILGFWIVYLRFGRGN